MKQKRDRYEMHKYWGKKPSPVLRELIEKYTNEGDTVLDPFAGYGVFAAEAFILNRNVVSNDINPIACFINQQLFELDVDLSLVLKQWKKIKEEIQPFVWNWFKWEERGNTVQLISVLRNKNDFPLKAKYRLNSENKCREVEISNIEAEEFIKFENNQIIQDWYPRTPLFKNSRISAKEGMNVSDLFTKRTLSCHARLLSLIEQYSSGKEKELFKLAFTSNLANCSKLVPPIKSRGEMAPGAWMTGFYVGETYLENNVLLYFENRLNKVLKGKQDFLEQIGENGQLKLGASKRQNSYRVLQNDARKIALKDSSVDFIFADPPYGDAVPYLEQSIIWNEWLQFKPDYENEIVISGSKEREKGAKVFDNEIESAFAEIRRVLKPEKFLSLTYHSLSGIEWKAITNACIKNGFEMIDYKWLVQKTFTPRQLNRAKTIKGDVLVTLQKKNIEDLPDLKEDEEVEKIFVNKIKQWLSEGSMETNEIFIKMMKFVLSERIFIQNADLFKVLSGNFHFSQTNRWKLYDKLELF